MEPMMLANLWRIIVPSKVIACLDSYRRSQKIMNQWCDRFGDIING